MTYSEFLASQGATADEIKILDVPVARKAFEASQAALAEADRIKEAAAQQHKDLNEWYENKQLPEYKRMEREMMSAKADAASKSALLQAAQDQGLIEIARQQDTPPAKAAAAAAPAFDPTKVPTWDQVRELADREGDAIALAQDIAAEHRVLFPDKPLNFRELRREAVAQKKSVETLWLERYGVSAARQARDAATLQARIDEQVAIKVKEKEAELVTRFSNPDLRPGAPSANPWSVKKTDRDANTAPWQNDTERQAARQQRATQTQLQSMAKPN